MLDAPRLFCFVMTGSGARKQAVQSSGFLSRREHQLQSACGGCEYRVVVLRRLCAPSRARRICVDARHCLAAGHQGARRCLRDVHGGVPKDCPGAPVRVAFSHTHNAIGIKVCTRTLQTSLAANAKSRNATSRACGTSQQPARRAPSGCGQPLMPVHHVCEGCA